MKVQGIHHISGIVKHPQENIDFYTSLLGLRLIKKAVNFDSANTYHFYYGNKDADIGTVITFFPWHNNAKEGIVGDGQVGITTYAIPKGSMDFWKDRLTSFKVPFQTTMRHYQQYLVFRDAHGIINELVESDQGVTNHYEYNGITSEFAIKGFHGAVLFSKDVDATKDFLTNILGIKQTIEDVDYYRFEMESSVGKYLDLFKGSMGKGQNSTGTNHHIALTVEDNELELFKEKIEGLGIKVSDIKNRDFFRALYFREPGGIVIELSSKEPGFNAGLIDDKATHLYLPQHFEDIREELESTLTPIFVREVNTLESYPYSNYSEYESYLAHKALLARINELARFAKERDLTEEEITERAILRKKYVSAISSSVTNITDSIVVKNEKSGTTKKLNDFKKKGK